MDEAGGIIEEAWPDARYVGLTFFPEPGGGAGGLSSSFVIRGISCPSVVKKEIRIQRSHNCLERTRPSVESKKAFQISSSTCVGKPERALAEIENTLDEPQDAAEVMGLVIDVLPGGPEHQAQLTPFAPILRYHSRRQELNGLVRSLVSEVVDVR